MDPNNLEAIQRGDLLFWKGHVAIAQSADWMVHASGHHMQVVVEPINRAMERTAELNGPLLAIIRPPVPQQASVQQHLAEEPKPAAIAQPQPAVELPAPASNQAAPAPAAPSLQTPIAAQAKRPPTPSPAKAAQANSPLAAAVAAAAGNKEKPEINAAAKNVATQIQASMAAHRGRSDMPAEPERSRGPSRPGEKPKRAG